MTLPASDYISAEADLRERRTVFSSSWLCLGPSWTVRTAKTFVSEVVAGVPVVVVRDDAEELRAFANVCAHRAGPLVDDETSGSCRAIVCGYHGWTYGLDGCLQNARDSEIDDASLQEVGLRRFAVDEWNGLLFVNLDGSAPPLNEWLAPEFVEQAEPYDIAAWEPLQRQDHDIASNWKTYADNYLEGYHIPFVHPTLARSIDVRSYEVTAGASWARHLATPRDGSAATGAWLWHWPNLALNLYEGGGSIERWWPTGPTNCRLRLDYCFADTSPGSMQRNRLDIESSTRLCEEDKRICEVVQRNLASGAYDRGVLSPRHERALVKFQSRVRGTERSTLPGGPAHA